MGSEQNALNSQENPPTPEGFSGSAGRNLRWTIETWAYSSTSETGYRKPVPSLTEVDSNMVCHQKLELSRIYCNVLITDYDNEPTEVQGPKIIQTNPNTVQHTGK